VLGVKTGRAVRSVIVVRTLFARNIQRRKQLQFVMTALQGQCDRRVRCGEEEEKNQSCY
jgi:hypothetical protein